MKETKIEEELYTGQMTKFKVVGGGRVFRMNQGRYALVGEVLPEYSDECLAALREFDGGHSPKKYGRSCSYRQAKIIVSKFSGTIVPESEFSRLVSGMGLLKSKLAEILGVTPQTVSRYADGSGNAPKLVLEKIRNISAEINK